jgi:hypothetical protein
MLHIQGKTRMDGWLPVPMADEILTMSRVTWPPDETKISSGVSQSHVGDESIEMVQYSARCQSCVDAERAVVATVHGEQYHKESCGWWFGGWIIGLMYSSLSSNLCNVS